MRTSETVLLGKGGAGIRLGGGGGMKTEWESVTATVRAAGVSSCEGGKEEKKDCSLSEGGSYDRRNQHF